MMTRLGAVARPLRTVVLWVVGPLDWVSRRCTGRSGLPPLWLRRHVGPVSQFESAARDMEHLLQQLGLVTPAAHVLEIGSGCGAMVPAFRRALGAEGRYVGFDVHAPSVRWCQRRFQGDGRFRFECADLASPYGNPSSPFAVELYRFPADDGSVNLVLAKSVFTHLLAPAASHYLAEIRRTLRPEGRALVTTFLFAEGTHPPAFPHPEETSPVRWRRQDRKESAVAYERTAFEQMISCAGLRIETFVPGFWPGTNVVPTGQDVLVLGRASTS